MTDILKNEPFFQPLPLFLIFKDYRGSWQDQLKGCSREAPGKAQVASYLLGEWLPWHARPSLRGWGTHLRQKKEDLE